VKGRKRHLMVDTMGFVLMVLVTSAGLQDDARPAIGHLLYRVWFRSFARLRVIFADGMYEGSAVLWARALGGWMMRIVKRADAAGAIRRRGFAPLPKRWVVERTFAWLGRYRRLSKDYEYHTHNSEMMIYLAMINLMVHRLEPG
jgi:putative transposase